MDALRFKPPTNIPQDDRLNMLSKEPQLIEFMLSHVADGGSLIDLAKVWDVRYSWLARLARSTPELSERYDKALSARSEFTREQILAGIRNLSTANIKELYDADGNLLPVHQWPDHVAATVSGVDVAESQGKGTVKKVKRESQTKAWELLGKTEAMFVEKVENKSIDSLAAVIAQTYGKPMPEEK